jgi:3-phosphoshikimate 1-carboxyvinyltransferase
VEGDDLVVHGGTAWSGGTFDAAGDHRMAMAAAVAGAACPRPSDRTTIVGWDSVATSYPGFGDHLASLTASTARAR